MQTRQIVGPVVLIAVIALAMGATIGSVSSGKTTTSLTTQTVTITTTSVTTQTIEKTSSNSTGELYELTFNQTDVCTNFGAFIPWTVILMTSGGTYSITEPSNASSIPLSECPCSPSGSAYSSIAFSVPNGTYSYVTKGVAQKTGNVTVEGQDVTVMITDYPASCGPTTTSSFPTSFTNLRTNSVKDNFQNSSLTFLIWSNNTSVQNPISNLTILTNDTVSCQVVQFGVNPSSYVFIHPAVVVNNNGSFFGLTYANGTSVSYLANASQDFYYTTGAISGTVVMTFTLPGHGSCD